MRKGASRPKEGEREPPAERFGAARGGGKPTKGPGTGKPRVKGRYLYTMRYDVVPLSLPLSLFLSLSLQSYIHNNEDVNHYINQHTVSTDSCNYKPMLNILGIGTFT